MALLWSPRTVADREDSLASVELFLCVGDLSGPIEVQVAVAHELGMHAEVLHIRLGDHAADGIGNPPDSQLERTAAGNIREDERGDPAVRIRCGRALDCRDRKITLYHRIHIADIDVVVGRPGDGGHGGVDLHHDVLRRVKNFLLGAVCKPKGKVSVFVHRRHRDHGHINRRIALAVIGPVVTEQHRHMVGAPLVHISAVQRGAVPEVKSKGAAGVILHGGDGDHGDRAADFDIVQYPASRRERGVEGLGVGASLTVVHPITVLHDPDGLFGTAELLRIKGMEIHICSPPDKRSHILAFVLLFRFLENIVQLGAEKFGSARPCVFPPGKGNGMLLSDGQTQDGRPVEYVAPLVQQRNA